MNARKNRIEPAFSLGGSSGGHPSHHCCHHCCHPLLPPHYIATTRGGSSSGHPSQHHPHPSSIHLILPSLKEAAGTDTPATTVTTPTSMHLVSLPLEELPAKSCGLQGRWWRITLGHPTRRWIRGVGYDAVVRMVYNGRRLACGCGCAANLGPLGNWNGGSV